MAKAKIMHLNLRVYMWKKSSSFSIIHVCSCSAISNRLETQQWPKKLLNGTGVVCTVELG